MASGVSQSPADELAAEYSAKAPAYDDCWAPVLHGFAASLLSRLPLASARNILEIGCGTGGLLKDLRVLAPEASIVGVDRSVGMLSLARGKLREPLAAGDAENLGLRDAAFDLVVCAFMLFHVVDPVRALREIRRVLQPARCAGIVVWGEDPGSPGIDIWKDELERHGAAPDPRSPDVMRQTWMNTEEKLVALLESAGFAPIRTWAERFAYPWRRTKLLALQEGCGAPSRRLNSLSPSSRRACLDRVAARYEELTDEDLVYRPQVLYAVAESPQSGS